MILGTDCRPTLWLIVLCEWAIARWQQRQCVDRQRKAVWRLITFDIASSLPSFTNGRPSTRKFCVWCRKAMRLPPRKSRPGSSLDSCELAADIAEFLRTDHQLRPEFSRNYENPT